MYLFIYIHPGHTRIRMTSIGSSQRVVIVTVAVVATVTVTVLLSTAWSSARRTRGR